MLLHLGLLDKCRINGNKWQDFICCQKTCPKNWTKLPLVLLSMDGFRADYLLRDKTSAIQSLINCGSHAPFMFPTFPSKTLPNHYSIVTVQSVHIQMVVHTNLKKQLKIFLGFVSGISWYYR